MTGRHLHLFAIGVCLLAAAHASVQGDWIRWAILIAAAGFIWWPGDREEP